MVVGEGLAGGTLSQLHSHTPDPKGLADDGKHSAVQESKFAKMHFWFELGACLKMKMLNDVLVT